MGDFTTANMNAQGGPSAPPVAEHVYAEHVQKWERMYSMCIHLTVVFFSAFPVVPALIMWAIKKDESHFVEDHGREAVNFQITLLLYGFALVPIGVIPCSAGWWIGLPVLVGLSIIGTIFAAVAAGKVRSFRYPPCLRFIKDRAAAA